MKPLSNTFLAFIVIIVSIVYQVHCAIHGFDLTDEGYLMSLYHWFGTDIDYAQGAGGYPLTCYLGWFLDHQFPNGGILGMRLWGILLVTLTEVIAYLYLKRYFEPKMILIGLLMQILIVSGDPKPFGYNTLTAFIGIIAFILICEGTLRRRYYLLFGGGLLLGANVFVRLPNLACLAFLVLPFIARPRETLQLKLRQSMLHSLTIGVGFISAAVLVWNLLVMWGADKLTVDLIKSIPETLGGDSTHASSSLLLKYAENYLSSIWHFVIFAALAITAGLAFRFKNKAIKLAVLGLVVFVLYQSTYMRSNMLGDTLLAMMNGLGLIGALYYYNKQDTACMVAIGAIIMSFIFPLGSDGGFQTMWVGTWLLLPIGLSGLYGFICDSINKKKAVSLPFCSFCEVNGNSKLKVSALQLRSGYIFCLLIFGGTIFIKTEYNAYYDPGSRTDKTYSINSLQAKGIYTGRDRTTIINPLLKNLNQYVKAGDTMLVYDSSPLIYYLTGTRPFAGIPWPCVFYGEQYVDKFRRAEKQANCMPVLVIQFFSSSNTWTGMKDNYYNLDHDSYFSNIDMKRNIHRFIRDHGYRTIWSNGYYKIMLPQEHTP